MKLAFKGKISSMEDFPKSELPENAVKYKEPENLNQLNMQASLYAIPLIVIIALISIFRYFLRDSVDLFNGLTFWALILFFPAILIHELLHAICFPKKAEVGIYYSIKYFFACVYSSCPLSKQRFIFLSAFPAVILGLIPLLIWLLIPTDNSLNNTLFAFGALNLIAGCGDLMNIVNTLKQVPKGAFTQMSGMNTYWYMPAK